MNQIARFEVAKANAIDLLDGVALFVRHVIESGEPQLLDEVVETSRSVQSLSYDPSTLVELPLFADDFSRGTRHADLRIERLFDVRFPPGHRFHEVNARRLGWALDRMREQARELRVETEQSALQSEDRRKLLDNVEQFDNALDRDGQAIERIAEDQRRRDPNKPTS